MTAPDECYCKETNKIYTRVNGIPVDSVNVLDKLYELKCMKNSEDRSKKVERIFHIIEYKPCKHGK